MLIELTSLQISMYHHAHFKGPHPDLVRVPRPHAPARRRQATADEMRAFFGSR